MSVPVTVPMMQVGIMGVTMDQACVPVPMGMRLASWHVRRMVVLMMFVMPMPMLVLHCFVAVFVIVPLSQM